MSRYEYETFICQFHGKLNTNINASTCLTFFIILLSHLFFCSRFLFSIPKSHQWKLNKVSGSLRKVFFKSPLDISSTFLRLIHLLVVYVRRSNEEVFEWNKLSSNLSSYAFRWFIWIFSQTLISRISELRKGCEGVKMLNGFSLDSSLFYLESDEECCRNCKGGFEGKENFTK